MGSTAKPYDGVAIPFSKYDDEDVDKKVTNLGQVNKLMKYDWDAFECMYRTDK